MSISVVTTDVIAAGGVLTALITIWYVVREMSRALRRVHDFLDDWNGEKARPGVPGRAGVMQRLDSIEHELHPNGSTSMRDAVDRIEHQVATNTLVLQASTPPTHVQVNVAPATGDVETPESR